MKWPYIKLATLSSSCLPKGSCGWDHGSGDVSNELDNNKEPDWRDWACMVLVLTPLNVVLSVIDSICLAQY